MKQIESNNKIFEQGDIVWVNLSPTSGHEQRGKRPALVFSLPETQLIDGVMIVLPLTRTDSRRKLSIDINTEFVYGKILVDQPRTIDPLSKEREVKYIGKCPDNIFEQVDELFDKLFHK